MIKIKFARNIVLAIAVLFSLTAFANRVFAQTVEPPLITQFDPDPKSQLNPEVLDLGIKRIRYVHLEKSALDQIASSLALSPEFSKQAQFQVFDNLSFMATFTDQEETLQGGYLLRGYLNGNKEDTITLVSTADVISAVLTAKGIQYQLNSDTVSQYRFEEIDQSQFPSEADNIALPENQLDSSSILDEPPVAQDSGALIDIMVVYTDDARASAGGTTNMVNLINLAVSETNTGYSHSGN